MEKATKYGWETQFDTANDLMTHTISEHVQVVSNIKKGEVHVQVNGETIKTYNNMPVKKYEATLLAVEAKAKKLERRYKAVSLLSKAAVWAISIIAMFAFIALGGDNDEWTLGMFATQKACCIAVIAGRYLSVKHTPARAEAWESMNK